MTNANDAIRNAELELEAAQRKLDEARAEKKFDDEFTEGDEIYLVIAKVPRFDQFVSYSNEGIPVASFHSRGQAQYYADGSTPPAGHELVVEPLRLRMKK